MTKEQIVKIRDLFHNADIRVSIFGDNAVIVDENLDAVVWDDENELVYSMSRTKTASPTDYQDIDKAAFFTVLGYDVIQYIRASSDYKSLKNDIIPNIPVNDTEREEKILKWFADTIPNRINAKPGTRPLKTIAKEDPELLDKIMGEGTAEKLKDED